MLWFCNKVRMYSVGSITLHSSRCNVCQVHVHFEILRTTCSCLGSLVCTVKSELMHEGCGQDGDTACGEA